MNGQITRLMERKKDELCPHHVPEKIISTYINLHTMHNKFKEHN